MDYKRTIKFTGVNYKNIWLSADHHFGHANIIRFCNRPFSSVEEMDEKLISNWNALVKQNDLVLYLGDFSLLERVNQYLGRLNGNIKVVPGSHDYRWIQRLSPGWATSGKIEILPRMVSISGLLPKLPVVLCHYAMRVWDKSHYGALHFYGHSHGKLRKLINSCDVGVDCWDFKPVNFLEAAEAATSY